MVRKIESANLRVNDVDEALGFYTNVMGLVKLSHDNDTVYLGCGLNNRYDLAISEGGTGLDFFSIRVTHDEFERYRQSLDDQGVTFEMRNSCGPGQERSLRLTLPSGINMETTIAPAERYSHISDTAAPARSMIAPLDLDHINLASINPEQDAKFLRDVLDFEITEVQGSWELVFTRLDDLHHDVGISIVDDPDHTIHHLGWAMSSLDHMKAFIDALAKHGLELEAGISRHLAGNNLFAYFWEPGGNRFELSAEMIHVEEGTPTMYREDSFTFTSWGGTSPPDSFNRGT